MIRNVLILIIIIIALSSCKNRDTDQPALIREKKIIISKNIQELERYNKFVDTKFEYIDSLGKSVVIQNSLPKGGHKYTSHNNKNYVYAVFWTRVANNTVKNLEVTIDLPAKSFELPSAPKNYFKIVFPTDSLTLDKLEMFNYGLANLNSFLNTSLNKSSSFRKIIKAKTSNNFYVVILSDRGISNTLRTKMTIKGQHLYYTINDKEIYCGQINFENLKLK